MQHDSQQSLHAYYGAAYDESGRLRRDRAHSVEWITTCETFRRLLAPGSVILDACAGTGAYAFDLAKAGHTVTAGDLMPNHVAAMQARQQQEPLLADIYEGSALDLSRFEDGSFDVVLNMGALYHLKDAADRGAAVRECLRVLKPGGLFFAATIHRHANVLKCRTSLADGGDLPYNVLDHGFDTADDLFYNTTPEETERLMSDCGLEQVAHVGTDGTGYLLVEQFESMTEEAFTRWLHHHLADCGNPNVLGLSLHGLYVGRKPAHERSHEPTHSHSHEPAFASSHEPAFAYSHKPAFAPSHEPPLLVSACLVGVNCRYNGGSTRIESLVRLFESGKALPVCPEMLGGLAAPRSPCEIQRAADGTERVMDRDGVDRTTAFREGAERTLAICRAAGIRKAVLQQRSPTCGHGIIYDGSFQSVRIPGNGITAQLLEVNGIEVVSDEEWL